MKMGREEVTKKLLEIVAVYVRDRALLDTITEDSRLVNELAISSIDLIDILLEVEQVFDITIDANEADSLNRVGTALTLIETKLSAKSPEGPARAAG
jgi:acyl carrier protein